MDKKKVSLVLDKFSSVGNEMLELVNDMAKEVTENGKYEVVFEEHTPITDSYVSLQYYKENVMYVTDYMGWQTSVEDLTLNDWFELVTILNDRNYYSLNEL